MSHGERNAGGKRRRLLSLKLLRCNELGRRKFGSDECGVWLAKGITGRHDAADDWSTRQVLCHSISTDVVTPALLSLDRGSVWWTPRTFKRSGNVAEGFDKGASYGSTASW